MKRKTANIDIRVEPQLVEKIDARLTMVGIRERNILMKQPWERSKRSAGPITIKFVQLATLIAPKREHRIGLLIAAGFGAVLAYALSSYPHGGRRGYHFLFRGYDFEFIDHLLFGFFWLAIGALIASTLVCIVRLIRI
jgi:hypothetical protein